MPIRLRCRCGKALIASRRDAGKTARCPKCRQRIRIPVKSPQPRTAAQPPAVTGAATPPPLHTPTADGTPNSQPPQLPAVALRRQTTTRGVEHDPGKRRVVAWLATLLALAAIIGCSPAVWQLTEQLRNAEAPVMEHWMTILLLLSGLQLAYAAYLFQLPDWSSVRIVTLVATLSTAPYAGVLGIGLRVRQQNPIVHWLGLAPQLASGRALAWCLLMITLTGLTALIAGRLASQWYHVPGRPEEEHPPTGKQVDEALSSVSAGTN